MPAKKENNYIKHKEELVKLIAIGSTCYSCLARKVCESICEERKIDTKSKNPPCTEAWLTWVNKTE